MAKITNNNTKEINGLTTNIAVILRNDNAAGGKVTINAEL